MDLKRLGWLYLAGISQYKPKIKGKTSQKLKELKGIGLLLVES